MSRDKQQQQVKQILFVFCCNDLKTWTVEKLSNLPRQVLLIQFGRLRSGPSGYRGECGDTFSHSRWSGPERTMCFDFKIIDVQQQQPDVFDVSDGWHRLDGVHTESNAEPPTSERKEAEAITMNGTFSWQTLSFIFITVVSFCPHGFNLAEDPPLSRLMMTLKTGESEPCVTPSEGAVLGGVGMKNHHQ